MKKRIALLPLLFFLLSCTPPEGVHAQQSEAVAFVDVNVLPMDGERVREGQTVLVRGDRIASVGPVGEVEVPAGALRIDGAGRYLLPGLAEMHGHIPSPDAPQQFIDDVLFLYLANGITTVRGMLGWPGQLALRDAANRGERLAPTLYLAGPSFSGQSIGSPEQAEEKVRTQVAEGWDLLKVHPGLTREEYDAMARTANELGIRFGGHVPEDVGLAHAIEMSQETFDHLDGYVAYLDGEAGPVDEAALAEAVRLTREAGAWVVPTMALWEVLYGTVDLETLRSYPELQYMPPDQVAQWVRIHEQRLGNPQLDLAVSQQVISNRMRILGALHEGGVPVLMGTDAPQQFSVPGFSLHRELERMRDAGMSPYAIIESGTVNVGRYFANEDTFGRIAVGQRADLMLVEENPLEDVTRLAGPAGVMVRGRWLSREALDERLARIAASYREDG